MLFNHLAISTTIISINMMNKKLNKQNKNKKQKQTKNKQKAQNQNNSNEHELKKSIPRRT